MMKCNEVKKRMEQIKAVTMLGAKEQTELERTNKGLRSPCPKTGPVTTLLRSGLTDSRSQVKMDYRLEKTCTA